METFNFPKATPIWRQPRALKAKIPMEQKVVSVDNEVYSYRFVNGKTYYLFLYFLKTE